MINTKDKDRENQQKKESSLSDFFHSISTFSQNASIHFDNMYYAVNTALQNSLRRKGNKIMKPKRAKIRHVLRRETQESSIEHKSQMDIESNEKLECIQELEKDKILEKELESMESSKQPIHVESVESVEPIKSKESEQAKEIIKPDPDSVQCLLDTSLDRIRKLEKQVQDLESSIQTALSNPPSPMKSTMNVHHSSSTPIKSSSSHLSIKSVKIESPRSIESQRIVHPPIMIQLLDEMKTHRLKKSK